MKIIKQILIILLNVRILFVEIHSKLNLFTFFELYVLLM